MTANDRNMPKPGVPNINDGSQPSAKEVMDEAARQAEAARRAVEADLHGDRDERLRRSEETDRDDRDGDLEIARGASSRTYSNEDWARARVPTDPERRRILNQRYSDALLPSLPQTEQWHRCWISTTNPADTPDQRRSVGYRFCSAEQLASEGWKVDEFAVKDARNIYTGCVMRREMIAMEIPMKEFHEHMREYHHDQPQDQARQIYENLQAAAEPVRAAGGRTSMAPGFEDMARFTRPPSQFTT